MERLQNSLDLRNKKQRVQFKTTGKALTEQSHKKDCDIRFIMKKAEKQGMLTHVNTASARYVDLASRPDFHEAQLVIANAASVFETIPAKVREKFKNDPSEFLEFIQDENNREEMLEMGFTDEHLPPLPVEDKPINVNVVNTTETETQEE